MGGILRSIFCGETVVSRDPVLRICSGVFVGSMSISSGVEWVCMILDVSRRSLVVCVESGY